MTDKVFLLEVLEESDSAYNQAGEWVQKGLYATFDLAEEAAKVYAEHETSISMWKVINA